MSRCFLLSGSLCYLLKTRFSTLISSWTSPERERSKIERKSGEEGGGGGLGRENRRFRRAVTLTLPDVKASGSLRDRSFRYANGEKKCLKLKAQKCQVVDQRVTLFDST